MSDRAQKLYDTDTKLSLAERLDFAMTTIENLDAKIATMREAISEHKKAKWDDSHCPHDHQLWEVLK